MKIVSQNLIPAVVESVTLTLTKEEVDQIASALDYRYYGGDGALAARLRSATTPGVATEPKVYVETGTIDGFIRDGHKITAIKEVRTVTGCTLRDAKDAVDARARVINY